MKNEQLEFELADLQLALQQAQLQSRINEKRQKLAKSQEDEETIAALGKHIAEKQAAVDRLTVRATRSGRIVGRNLDALVGLYIRAGDELFTIGNEQLKELRISVAQEDFDAFENCLGGPAQVRVSGSEPLQGRLVKLQPRASVQVEHQSLGADVGGPLPVKRKEAVGHSSSRQADRYEFLTPRFTGTVELSAAQSAGIRCGQLAVVSLPTYRETVAGHIYSLLMKWFRDKLQLRRDGDDL